ncbi:hypothetical protein [Streptomyces sp. ISL-100]|uniref:hypothetical protein n=1 Tax=Streptomyces sp. ISL-100 TaxID=2819173 RepID=UPI001BE855DB|nr:hypothetical protein [Streptomyces sp. ISL-100]MBT2400551.1 hypothetical protein [Streptomyces sp. ISL-100]
MLDAVTIRFIGTAAKLAPDALAAVYDHMVRLRGQGGREASRALKLSASHESELQAKVRSTLLPRADELNAFRSGLLSGAKSAYVIAARAVYHRESLAQEHYQCSCGPSPRRASRSSPARPARTRDRRSVPVLGPVDVPECRQAFRP